MSKVITNELVEKIQLFFSERFQLDEPFPLDGDLRQYPGFDSMAVVEFILFLEEELGETMPNELYMLDNYDTLDHILSKIETLDA